MVDKKLFSVVAQGRLKIVTRKTEGHAPPYSVQVQVVLRRCESIEEACEFFNSIADLSFEGGYAQPAIITQSVEH